VENIYLLFLRNKHWFHLLCPAGELADLIFVYFDPIGQALCKRTLNIVEQLNTQHPERLRFYLSKADEAGQESDRQRLVLTAPCSFPFIKKKYFLLFKCHLFLPLGL
jgi:hypothetical protein